VPVAVFVVLLILSVFIIKPLLISLFLGAILAYAVYPLYRRLTVKNKTIAAALICILVLLILIIPAIFLVKGLVQESYTLYQLVREKVPSTLMDICQVLRCWALQDLAGNEAVIEQIQTAGIGATSWLIAK